MAAMADKREAGRKCLAVAMAASTVKPAAARIRCQNRLASSVANNSL